MQNLELDTFQYEEDTSLGTLQIEQVENGTKIMVEFFPHNQSKESFENAEFSEVYDILELSPLALNTGVKGNFNKIYPTGITKEQEHEIDRAIVNGISSMLETILNLEDFRGVKINTFTKGEVAIYPTLETIRREYLLREVNSFLKYRAEEEPLPESTSTETLENAFRIIDTINETDQTRTQNILKYLNNLAQ